LSDRHFPRRSAESRQLIAIRILRHGELGGRDLRRDEGPVYKVFHLDPLRENPRHQRHVADLQHFHIHGSQHAVADRSGGSVKTKRCTIAPSSSTPLPQSPNPNERTNLQNVASSHEIAGSSRTGIKSALQSHLWIGTCSCSCKCGGWRWVSCACAVKPSAKANATKNTDSFGMGWPAIRSLSYSSSRSRFRIRPVLPHTARQGPIRRAGRRSG